MSRRFGGAVEPEASAAHERNKRFVLVDRDGTINEEIGYVLRPDELRLIPGAAGALRELQDLGLGLVVVTNQSPIGRGMLDPEGLEAIHDRLRELSPMPARARPDRALPAPSRRGMRVPQARHADGRARGRRPRVRSRRSWIVGDHAATCASAAPSARTILVRTGHGEEELAGGADAFATTSRTISRRRRPVIRDEVRAEVGA